MESFNKSFEPMDVDLSAHSISAMDISDNQSTPEIRTAQSKENVPTSPECIRLDSDDCHIISSSHLPAVPRKNSPVSKLKLSKKITTDNNAQRKQKKPGIDNKIKILTMIFVVIVSAAIYQCRIHCFKEFDYEHIKDTLSSHVIGQDEALKSILTALREDNKYKVIFFYGGTGVGKSYVSSLLMDSLGPSSNLYHYTMPSFIEAFSSDVKIGLYMCDSSLIVIDDLSLYMNISEQINEIITKSYNLQKNMTIILIYNCPSIDNIFHKKCDTSLDSKLLKMYYSANTLFSFIKFESLTEEHLKKCIDRELGVNNLDKITYEKLIKNFNVTSDGCKGVHTKVKMFNNI